MKIFIVCTNTSSTAIVKAQDEKQAIDLALEYFKNELDIDYTDEIVAYDALEYFENFEVVDIDLNY